MVIGGCAGGAYAAVAHRLWPELVPHPASFVIVGMAGFFAAAAKTPFSTIIIVCEMTGGYHLLLPALWVCVLSFVFSDERSLYSSQLETRAMSPAHRGALARALVSPSTVGDHLIEIASVPVLSAESSIDRVIERIIHSRLDVLPVADPAGKLVGIVTLGDVLAISQEAEPESATTASLVRTDVAPLSPGDQVETAMRAFAEYDVLALPVVDGAGDGKLVGMVKRFDVSSAYLRAVGGADLRMRTDRH
jgi:CIC family chloride channel protein